MKNLNEFVDESKLKKNEYTDGEGLIHCSVCGKAKQVKTIFGIHRAMCECELRQAREEEQRLKEAGYRLKVKRLREYCFDTNPSLSDKTFENSEINNASLKLCYNYCTQFKSNKNDALSLILCGDVGCGKTYLACCILNKIIDDYTSSVRFITEYDFLNGYMQSNNKDSYIREYASCSLLVLDDFGTKCFNKSKPNGYLTYINDLIDARYKKGYPIIITTNLGRDFFLQKHSSIEVSRIISRLNEMAGTPIEIKANDLRRSRGEEKIKRLRELAM